MRIDLHTHSTASDGTLAPAEVIREAAAAGLDVVALTDHDTSAGWAAAEQAAVEAGIALVRGMEISTRTAGRSVHLLAYLVDPEHPDLVARLARIVAGRDDRIPAMLRALAAQGMELDPEDIEADVPGRPHVADALVRRYPERVRDRDQAFAEWLSPGCPAYIDRYAPTTLEMIDVVSRAGGVGVIAHPWARDTRAVLTRERFAAFREAGLAGIEVDHQGHVDPDVRPELRALAADLDLLVTGSSDFHGAGKRDHDLGVHTTAPDVLDTLVARSSGDVEVVRP